MKSLSFDGMANLYDETRACEQMAFTGALDWVTGKFPPSEFHRVLEPGIGTGRIALPLAERGYHVAGLDVSREMLDICHTRCRDIGVTDRIDTLIADATAIPFSAGSFDLVMVAHLFYFIPDWQTALREMLRTLRPGGALISLRTGFGAEVPEINERYKSLAREQGYVFPIYGVQSTQEVLDYAQGIGCNVESVDDPSWEWSFQIKTRDALSHLRSRAYSFLKSVPQETHDAVVDQIALEFFGAHTYMEVPNRISLAVISVNVNELRAATDTDQVNQQSLATKTSITVLPNARMDHG